MTLGDRVAVLNHGRLQQCAPPRELYEQPVNAFVAGFIGSPQMNLIRTPLNDGSISLGEQSLALPRRLLAAAGRKKRAEIIMGIRPEHITVQGESGDGIPAEVVLVESMGADAYLHASLSGLDTRFVARTEGRDPPPAGARVRLRVDPERMYAFDAETEERLGDEQPPQPAEARAADAAG